jgi:hypothetical protein
MLYLQTAGFGSVGDVDLEQGRPVVRGKGPLAADLSTDLGQGFARRYLLDIDGDRT